MPKDSPSTYAYPLLETIEFPEDLRALPVAQLEPLARELRSCLLETVARSGGHLAAGLGVVELTVALHYVLDTPRDRLIWDVGHQAYPHKILTGRRQRLPSVRKLGGLSGFPSRAESVYDAFGVAHAGTSISAALGMAAGAALEGGSRRVVAVIGDGGLTAGMAFEALNHAGDTGADLLVILNDNGMSISPNVGALNRCCAPGRGAGRSASPHEPAALFEALGFDYSGPIDGHDMGLLVATLRRLLRQRAPRLLHVITRKGKGYAPAERDPVAYHAVAPFDPNLGLQPSAAPESPPTYTQIFSAWLCAMAAADPRLVAITPAMREGSGLVAFAERHPHRFFDAGIAEQHAVTLAAGLACEGFKPVMAIYSAFLQRAYDQLIHDVALQNLPVLFAVDRGGLVGADGPTHHGSFDLSFLRCIPNLVIMVPADEDECRRMLCTGFEHTGPAVVRYPRGRGPGTPVTAALGGLPLGQAEPRRLGKSVAILSFGSLLAPAMEAAEQINASVVNMRFVKPLDDATVLRMAESHDLLVTVEDNALAGGAGGAVNECLAARQVSCAVLNLGLPDRFIGHGTQAELLAGCGLDGAGIAQAIIACYPSLFESRRRCAG